MKILGIRNIDGRELPQQVYLMADSSVIRTNKPFFIPHFASTFVATPAIVLHIGRLGKHIAPRYAHLYCNAISPAVKVTARKLETTQENEQHSALSHSFDGALLLGDSSDINELDINSSIVQVNLNNVSFKASCLEDLGISFQSIISQLSVFFTLKMGNFGKKWVF